MRSYTTGLIALFLVGCASRPTSPPGSGSAADPVPLPAPADPLPAATGSYLGHYVVPAPADLAAAAIFPVDQVDWTVVGGVATLHYNLPRGLVGGTVAITLTGTAAPGATQISVTSALGTGACVAAGTKVTCREVFGDLGTLPISMPVVEQVAATQFAGPVASRVAIANVFGNDPIGFVDFDLSQPVTPDPGHGGGGGGGGGGSGHP
jgi:hypothetical protein